MACACPAIRQLLDHALHLRALLPNLASNHSQITIPRADLDVLTGPLLERAVAELDTKEAPNG